LENNRKHTKRGWEWTEEERDSIKPLKRKLEKQFKSVELMVVGIPNALPKFASYAEIYGNPYLVSVKEILKLDSRRKGKKWQDIPFSSVPKKLSKIAEIYLEYQVCFLAREDFQSALKDYNRGVNKKNREIKKVESKIIEKLILSNLEYLESFKLNKEQIEKETTDYRECLYIAGIIKLNQVSKLPENEKNILHNWLVIQFIDIASRQNLEILKYAREKILKTHKPKELFNDVYVLIIEQQIYSFNNRIKNSPPSLFQYSSAKKAVDSLLAMILETIIYRLNKIIETNPNIIPSQLEFSLFDRSL